MPIQHKTYLRPLSAQYGKEQNKQNTFDKNFSNSNVRSMDLNRSSHHIAPHQISPHHLYYPKNTNQNTTSTPYTTTSFGLQSGAPKKKWLLPFLILFSLLQSCIPSQSIQQNTQKAKTGLIDPLQKSSPTSPIQQPEPESPFLSEHIKLIGDTHLLVPISESLNISRNEAGGLTRTLTVRVSLKEAPQNEIQLSFPNNFHHIPLIVDNIIYDIQAIPNPSNNEENHTLLNLNIDNIKQSRRDEFLRPIQVVLTNIDWVNIQNTRVDEFTLGEAEQDPLIQHGPPLQTITLKHQTAYNTERLLKLSERPEQETGEFKTTWEFTP